MSRIGKLPIKVDASVKVVTDGNHLRVSKGSIALERFFSKEVMLNFENDHLVVQPVDKNDQKSRAIWGLSRTLAFNMIKGVNEGWSKRLELIGVGYKATVTGRYLVLSLGYSHDIIYAFPENIEIKTEKPTTILISGADKQSVGQIAAEICSLRKPDPYKGKGVLLSGKVIRRKENKKK